MIKVSAGDYQRRLDKTFGLGEFCLLTFTKVTQPVTVKCKHGHTIEYAMGSNFLRSRGCESCNAKVRVKEPLANSYSTWLWNHGGYAVVLDDYVDSMTLTVLHGCNFCGHEFLAIPIVLKRAYSVNDNGCRDCFPKEGGSYAWTEQRYKTALKARHGDAIILLGTYVTQNVNVLHRCNVCGHEWYPHPGLLLSRHGCTVCGMRKSAANASKRKSLELRGRRFEGLQGYEPQALEWIVENKHISVDDIVTASEGAPALDYTFEGRVRKHFPDLFVPNRNLLIEVKSSYTFKSALKKNQAKRRAAKAQGFRYVTLVLGRDGLPLELPTNWHTMPASKLLKDVPWLKN